MAQTRSSVLLLARAGVLGIALVATWIASGRTIPSEGPLRAVAWGIAGWFVLGTLVPRWLLVRSAAPMTVVAGDVLLLGAAASWLGSGVHVHSLPPSDVSFLAAYIVALLVAVTGRSAAAATLGGLAATLLVLLEASTAEAPKGPVGGEVLLGLRLLALWAAAWETGAVTGWLDLDARRRRTAQAVEKEVRARDAQVTDVAALLSQTSSAESLKELAEALLAHLRRHFPVDARAVLLEDSRERTAIWEESGRLDRSLIERRCASLLKAAQEIGAGAEPANVEVRSTSPSAPARANSLTTTAVPIHATGRVAGVILLADGRRQALAGDRVGTLAEIARQTGEAVRRIERSREAQRRRMALLLGQTREGVLVVGPDGRVTLANPAARELLLRLGQDADGRITLGDLTSEELAKLPPGTVRRCALTAAGSGGRPARVMATAEGVLDGQERLGTLVTLADVTEEENSRQRLMQAEKMVLVGHTLASVAHELANPLAAIVSYADLLQGAGLPPEAGRILSRVREQATRTSRIVASLLSVARRRGPERGPVNLNEVVTSVGDLLASEARANDVVLVPDLDGALPAVEGDRGALQQVLVNLVRNAVQAIRATGKPGRVDLATAHGGGAVRVAVRDDGPGVPDAVRARLFEPFVTSKGEEGGGLGLAISRGIARDHGGELAHERREDGEPGAQFTMRLPILAPAAARKREIAPAALGRILVVDDEEAVRDAVAATLNRLGAEAEAVPSGEEALRRCEGPTAWDGVLLDLRLEGAAGLDVHRRLRSLNPVVARRVVFMTGDHSDESLLREARATGRPVLEKPFTADELRRALTVPAGA